MAPKTTWAFGVCAAAACGAMAWISRGDGKAKASSSLPTFEEMGANARAKVHMEAVTNGHDTVSMLCAKNCVSADAKAICAAHARYASWLKSGIRS